MHWHEDAIDTDEGEPEMQLPETFIHHAANHLGHPEIRSRKYPEDRGNGHNEVEVRNHEICCVKIGVQTGLRQEEAADTAADEHRDKSEGEQGCGGEPQIGAVNRPKKD